MNLCEFYIETDIKKGDFFMYLLCQLRIVMFLSNVNFIEIESALYVLARKMKLPRVCASPPSAHDYVKK